MGRQGGCCRPMHPTATSALCRGVVRPAVVFLASWRAWTAPSLAAGMEAISKQRFDAPSAAAAQAAVEGAGGTGRGRASGRALRRAAARLAYLRPGPVPTDLGAAMLAHHTQRQAQQRAQPLLQQAEQHGAEAAAASPARQQAAAQPQGSVQSDMAAVGNRRRDASGKPRTPPASFRACRVGAVQDMMQGAPAHVLCTGCPPAAAAWCACLSVWQRRQRLHFLSTLLNLPPIVPFCPCSRERIRWGQHAGTGGPRQEAAAAAARAGSAGHRQRGTAAAGRTWGHTAADTAGAAAAA